MGKIVLFDVDSIFYTSCYDVEDFEGACHKFDEQIQSIVNEIEEHNEIDHVYFLGLCRHNFRYKIDPNYKGNRKSEKPDYLDELQQYMKKEYSILSQQGIETDDLVVKLQKEYGHENTIICSIDKDYLQCEGTIYNYYRKEYHVIDEKTARFNFWSQMITGDSGDNVNYLKGYGAAWVRKNMHKDDSLYTQMRIVYSLFKTIYKSKARERFIQQYWLLKLNA
jgi:5'-3' exonuclease